MRRHSVRFLVYRGANAALPAVIWSFVLCLLLPGHTAAQADTSQQLMQQQDELLERITENGEEQSLDYENIIDLESSLGKHPINLNKAGREDFQPLLDLKLITDVQVSSILQYRSELGAFLTIFELQAVPYLDLATIEAIRPYVFVSDEAGAAIRTGAGTLLTKGEYQLLIRGTGILEEQKGFAPPDSNSLSRYEGSPLNLYMRFRYSYGTRFSYGITGQKDAGETFFTGSQKQGFDFYSAHLFYTGKKFVKAVALGDYELNFGQGLIVSAGYGVHKSYFITMVKNGGRTIRPYTATDEFNFFRGGAVMLGNKNLTATLFASHKKIDGTLGKVDTVAEDIFITSYGGNGYHRTPSEIANKNTISQNVFGGNLEYAVNRFSAGATFFHTDFSSPVQPSYQPYNAFYFRGDHLNDYGLHMDWQYRNFNLFAEGVKSDPGGWGGVAGMLMSVSPRVDLALIYRNYAKDFHSIYAQGFGESSTSENEKGLYNGIIVRPSGKWELDAYADLFSRPWLSYLVSSPSTGSDFLAQLNYKPSKALLIYVKWRDRKKETNSSATGDLTESVPYDLQSFRFNIAYKASTLLTFSSRAEWTWYHEEGQAGSRGFLAYQDVDYKLAAWPLQLRGRLCLFDADSYDARIYTYEDDVLYAFSVPGFSNRGIRWYLLARYRIMHGVDIWVRFAQTYYSDLNTIGSGLDQINGNTRSELKVEARWRF